MDIHVDVKADSTLQAYNLQTMYEKKGGVCTLISGYSKPIYVISMCPLGTYHTVVRELCEHAAPLPVQLDANNAIDITKTPVQDEEGFVYRNMYCAQCHNVAQMQAWTTNVDCDHPQALSISDGTKKVTVLENEQEVADGCHRKLTPSMQRMIHECGHMEVVSSLNQWFHQPRISEGSRGDSSPFPLSFSILMNFGFDGKTHILFTTQSKPSSTYSNQCSGPNEKYDPLHDKCRPIVCNQGYKLKDGNCEKMMNYEISSNSDLAQIDEDEPVQVVLTIKNVTYGDIVLYSLIPIQESLTLDLAKQFNISVSRIQNLTLNIANMTSDKNSIEIHRFTTPLPSMSSEASHNPIDLQPIKDGAYFTTKPKLRLHNETSSKSAGNDYESLSDDEEDDDGNSTKEGHIQKHPYPIPRNKTTNNDHATNDDNAHDIPMSVWMSPLGMSLKMSFILLPARENKTLLEKSVKTVVKAMSDLWESKSFILSINGTEYPVDDFQTPPSSTPIDLFCLKGFHPFVSDMEFEIKSAYDARVDRNVTVIQVFKTGAVYFPGQYDLTLNIESSVGALNETEYTTFAFVCDMPKIMDTGCGQIILNASEYELFDNKSIQFGGHIYDTHEYEYEDEEAASIRICSPDWLTSQVSYEKQTVTMACGDGLLKVMVAESYLSFILGIVSLICMLSVLVTYATFEKLRNLPGMNTVNLTLSLFLGELFFIVSGWVKPQLGWLCSAFGVVLHFLFLSSFFWMNVMSYDVYKTFANKTIIRRVRDKQKYMLRYSLYAWGMPLIIVSLCSLFDFGKIVEGIKVGYGGSETRSPSDDPDLTGDNLDSNSTSSETDKRIYSIGCWIQVPEAAMAAFGGPMLLVLISNAFMFIRTILSIRACTESTKSSIRKTSLNHVTGKDDVMLYVRMSTVMGFTWVFGLASSFVSSFARASETVCIVLHTLGILFIVFNCSQGIFIFFAFVFNRRILGLYKAKFSRGRENNERGISVSSSRTTLSTRVSNTSLSHIR